MREPTPAGNGRRTPSLLILAAGLTLGGATLAQVRPDLSHAAKFECTGDGPGGSGDGVAVTTSATVHNPHGIAVSARISAVESAPAGGGAGASQSDIDQEIPPGAAIAFDCTRYRELLSADAARDVEGLLIVRTTYVEIVDLTPELDVVATYLAEGIGTSAVDVESIVAKAIIANPQPDFYASNPYGAGFYCPTDEAHTVTVRIGNRGRVASAAAVVGITFDDGNPVWDVIPPLEPLDYVDFKFPYAPACLVQSCRWTVVADADNRVAELNESNNYLANSCIVASPY